MEQLQGQLQPPVVEGGQGVVQEDGGALRQAQLAHRQPDRQIELIRRPSGQIEGAAGQDAVLCPDGPLQLPAEGHGGVSIPGEPGHIPARQPVQFGGEPLLEPGIGLGQGLHGQTDGLQLLPAPGQGPLQRLLPGGQGGGIPHGPQLSLGLVQLGGHPLQPIHRLRQGAVGLLRPHTGHRQLRHRALLGPGPLSGQVVQTAAALLDALPGQGQLMLQAQGPGQGGGTAEHVLDLRGEGVDEVQQFDLCEVPLVLPLGDGLSDDLHLVGGPLRRLTPLLVALGQGGELLRGADAVSGQDAPGLLSPAEVQQSSPRRHGGSPRQHTGDRAQGGGLPPQQEARRPADAAAEGQQQEDPDPSFDLARCPDRRLAGSGLRLGLHHRLLPRKVGEVLVLRSLLRLDSPLLRLRQGGRALLDLLLQDL